MTPRRLYGAAFAATMVVGIISRTISTGWVVFDKYLGDALYAVAIYLVLALVWPRRRAFERAIITTVAVVAIECFQLNGWAAEWRESSSALVRLVSVVLGTTFGWWDLIAYFVGIAAIYVLDERALDRRMAEVDGNRTRL